MSKLFDRFSAAAFTALNTVFGSVGSWVSEDGLVVYTGPVLFNNPTMREAIDQMSFIDSDPFIEYLSPAFPGLKTRVDSALTVEIIYVDGVAYSVQAVNQMNDGNTYKAYLLIVTNGYGPKNQ